jgi:hypothetical protein
MRKPAAWRRAGPRGGGLRRRGAVVLLLALAYAAGMLMFLLAGRLSGGGSGVEVTGSSSPLQRGRRRHADAQPPPQPGSVYRSHLVFERLWPAMRDDATLAASASSLASSASWRRSMVSAPLPVVSTSSDHPLFLLRCGNDRGLPASSGAKFRFSRASLLRLFLGFSASIRRNIPRISASFTCSCSE